MNVINVYSSVINSGIKEQHSHTFSDKLRSRNKLAFICTGFSIFYLIFFLKEGMYVPFVGISAGITLFILSIILNSYGRYAFSSLLIIINTNYCVLFFSLYMGLASGIHLYLFTSPLIALMSFDTKNIKLIFLAMSSYLINYLIIFSTARHNDSGILNLPAQTLNTIYFLNFSGSFFILIILSCYFLYNNNRTNSLLIQKNAELRFRQKELAEENKIRKEAEDKANEALSEKEILLSEIHHRVKNNLAVVSGMLEIHTINVKDTGVLKVVKQCQNRIKSMAILHEKLYENNTLTEIAIQDYIYQLLKYISGTNASTEQKIIFKSNIENIYMEMSRAQPFGLLLNELITNSYKHAFKNNTRGIISIDLKKERLQYELIYRDNGTGFVYTHKGNRNSLGLTLIETFSKQLNGTYGFKPNENGMEFKIKFL